MLPHGEVGHAGAAGRAPAPLALEFIAELYGMRWSQQRTHEDLDAFDLTMAA
jgi:hypothetical protein